MDLGFGEGLGFRVLQKRVAKKRVWGGVGRVLGH